MQSKTQTTVCFLLLGLVAVGRAADAPPASQPRSESNADQAQISTLIRLLQAGILAEQGSAIARLAEMDEAAEPALPQLLTLLERGDPQLRTSLIFAISRIAPDSPRFIKEVVEGIYVRPSSGCDDEMIALQSIEDLPRFAIPALAALLESEDDGCVLTGLYGLAAYEGLPCDIEPTVCATVASSNGIVRASGANNLSQFGECDGCALPTLVGLLSDDDPAVQKAAAGALLWYGERGLGPLWAREDLRRTTAEEIKWAFQQLPRDKRLGLARACFNARHEALAILALKHLRSLHPYPVSLLSTIDQCYTGAGEAYRSGIARVIVARRDDLLLPPEMLVSFLIAERWLTRENLATAIAAYGQESVPLLLHGVRSESPAMRSGCVVALGKIGLSARHGSLDAALRLSKDADPRVRADAAGALGYYRHPSTEIQSALQALLVDEEAKVQRAARRSLARRAE